MKTREREMAGEREIYLFALFILLICAIGGIAVGQAALSQKYYPIYDNKTQSMPIYKNVIEKVEYQCVMDNKTMAVSTCTKDAVRREFDKMITITISSKIIGYSDGHENIIGYVNLDKGIIIRWGYDIKGRNLKDHPACVQYEKDKGFCDEIY